MANKCSRWLNKCLERYLERKKIVSRHLYQVNEKGIRSVGIAYFLIIIQWLQLLGLTAYANHPDDITKAELASLRSDSLGVTLLKLLHYTQLLPLQPYMGVFNPFILIFSYFVLGLIVANLYVLLPQTTRYIAHRRWCLNFLPVMLLLYEYVIFVPGAQLSMWENIPATNVNPAIPIAIECYDKALMIIFEIMYYTGFALLLRSYSFMMSFRDYSLNVLSRPASRLRGITLILKLVVVVMTGLAREGKMAPWIADVMALCTGIIIFVDDEHRDQNYHNRKVATLQGTCAVIYITFNIIVIVLHTLSIKSAPVTKLLLAITCFVTSFIVRIYWNCKGHQELLHLRTNTDKVSYLCFQGYLREVIRITQQCKPSAEDALRYNIMVLNHSSHCKDVVCACQSHRAYLKGDDLRTLNKANTPVMDIFLKNSFQEGQQLISNREFNRNWISSMYCVFFTKLKWDPRECFPVMIDYLSYMTFGADQKGKAYVTALRFQQKIPKREFLKAVILETIISEIEQEIKKDLDYNQTGFFETQFKDVIEFSETKQRFFAKIDELKQQHSSFFAYLLEPKLEIDKIFKMGNTYLKLRDEIDKLFLRAYKLNPNDLALNQMRIDYNRDIVETPSSDYQELTIKCRELIHKKYSKGKKTLSEIKTSQALWDENAAVAIIALGEQDPGRLVKYTPTLLKMFGYENENELPALHINSFMPPTFAKRHRAILLEYQNKGEIDYTPIVKRLYGFSRDGYVVPIEMIIKFEPFQGQPTAAGLLSRAGSALGGIHIITQLDGTIKCYSKQLKEMLGLPETKVLIGINIVYLIPKLAKYFLGSSNGTGVSMAQQHQSGGYESFNMIFDKRILYKEANERLKARCKGIYGEIKQLLGEKWKEELELRKYGFNCSAKEDAKRSVMIPQIKGRFAELYRDVQKEALDVFKVNMNVTDQKIWRGEIQIVVIHIKEFKKITTFKAKNSILERLEFFKRSKGGDPDLSNKKAEKFSFGKENLVKKVKQMQEVPHNATLPELDIKSLAEGGDDKVESIEEKITSEPVEIRTTRKELTFFDPQAMKRLDKAEKREPEMPIGEEIGSIPLNLQLGRNQSNNSEAMRKQITGAFEVDIMQKTQSIADGTCGNTGRATAFEYNSNLFELCDQFPLTNRDSKYNYTHIPYILTEKPLHTQVHPLTDRADLEREDAFLTSPDEPEKFNSSCKDIPAVVLPKTDSIAMPKVVQVDEDELPPHLGSKRTSTDDFSIESNDSSSGNSVSIHFQRGSHSFISRRAMRKVSSAGSARQGSKNIKAIRDIINTNKISGFILQYSRLASIILIGMIALMVTHFIIGYNGVNLLNQHLSNTVNPSILSIGFGNFMQNLVRFALLRENKIVLDTPYEYWLEYGYIYSTSFDAVQTYQMGCEGFQTNDTAHILTHFKGDNNLSLVFEGSEAEPMQLYSVLSIPLYYMNEFLLDRDDENDQWDASATFIAFFVANEEMLRYIYDQNQYYINLAHEHGSEKQEAISTFVFGISQVIILLISLVLLQVYLKILRSRHEIIVLFCKLSTDDIISEVKRFMKKDDVFTQMRVNQVISEQKKNHTKLRHKSSYKLPKTSYMRLVPAFFILYLVFSSYFIIDFEIMDVFINKITSMTGKLNNLISLLDASNEFMERSLQMFNITNQDNETRAEFYHDKLVLSYNQTIEYFENFNDFVSNYELLEFRESYNSIVSNYVSAAKEKDFCYLLSVRTYSDDYTPEDAVRDCQGFYGGISNQGFLVSFKKIIDSMYHDSDLLVNLQINDVETVVNITSSNEFKTYDKFSFYVILYMEQLVVIFLKNIKDLAEDMAINQIGLLIYGLLQFGLCIVVGWFLFLRNMSRGINKAKKVLNLLPMSIIKKDAYIRKFLKAETA